MIHIIDGNLLTAEGINIIGHQANCRKTMGAGIALQIKQMFPEAYQADMSFPFERNERLGKCSYGISKTQQKIIFNLYGQDDYGKYREQTDYESSYKALEDALHQMFQEVDVLEQRYKKFKAKVGFPFMMACDLAGGNWETVYGIFEKMSSHYNRDIYLYRYTPKRK